MTTTTEPLTREQWMERARELFGDEPRDWKVVCPVCGTVQSCRDFEEHTDIPKEQISGYMGFSCIGRWARGGCEHEGIMGKADKPGPDRMGCDYAGGGLFKLNPVTVTHDGREHHVFAFAEEQQ
ncbi:MAG: hypothetical protein KJO40_19535 [Deltaproteobacteria bacterium]|nr:hypothetical protein [Deltaproteobacteria bacterium]